MDVFGLFRVLFLFYELDDLKIAVYWSYVNVFLLSVEFLTNLSVTQIFCSTCTATGYSYLNLCFQRINTMKFSFLLNFIFLLTTECRNSEPKRVEFAFHQFHCLAFDS